MRLGALAGFVCVLAACTEPNPFANMDSDDGGTTAGTASSMTTSATTTSEPTTTASTSMPTSDPSTSSGTPTTDESGSPDTPVVCPESHTCVAEAPEGWSGPVVLATTPVGMEPACAGDYPEAALTAFDDLVAPPANCECDCGAQSGATCTNPTLEYDNNSSTCGTVDNDWTVTTGCTTVSGAGSDYWRVERPEVTGGDCEPMVVTDDVPDWSWDTAITSCGGMFEGIGCEAGALCMRVPEPPFEAALCIWHEDAISCPEGEYQDRRIYYTEVSDTRECGECTCGNAEGDCGGSVYLFSGTNCVDLPIYTVAVTGNCYQSSSGSSVARARWAPGTITASCEPSEGMPMGLATGAGRHTVCCRGV